MNSDLIQQAVQAAMNARSRAYAPYSRFAVGAAIIGREGQIHGGCNIENSSYGLTICAERVAIQKAVSEGVTSFAELVVVSPGGKTPCGACLQVIAEFADDDLPIRLVDAEDRDQVVRTCLADLLPTRFRLGET